MVSDTNARHSVSSSETFVARHGAARHNAGMGKRDLRKAGPSAADIARGRRIQRALLSAGLNFTEAAELIGVTRSAVSQWARGQTDIHPANMRNLSTHTKFRFEWLQTGLGPERLEDDIRSEDVAEMLTPTANDDGIPVVGYVGAAGQLGYYNLPQDEHPRIPRRSDDPPNAVAATIMGTSLGPALDGWFAIYDREPGPVTPAMIGKLCVVWLTDDRVLVKQIRRNRRSVDRFDLHSNNPADPAIEAVEIDRATLVVGLRPE